MTDVARRRLAAAQTALVRALLAGDAPPTGLDADRLSIEAATLLAKRRRMLEHLRPDLVDRVGPRFAELYTTWATANPRRYGTTPQADADSFGAWLISQGHLQRPRRRRRTD